MTWKNERRKLRDLIPWEDNPRKIKKDDAARLVDSLSEFGQIETIAIDPENKIVDGHQRSNVWKMARQFGPNFEVDVRVSNRALTDQERKKIVIFLHQGAVGEWDMPKLEENFPKLDLLDWGWTETALKKAGFKDPDPAPATAPAPATVSALSIGVVNPKWNKKRTVRFLSIRSWRGASRAKEIERMKVIKRECNPSDVAAVAAELQDVILGMVKNCAGCFVTTAPKGHSRAALHFSDEVAKVLAVGLGVPYVKMFSDRELKGSSHPGNWNQRGGLTVIANPPQPICIFIDDIATSGATVEQATAALEAWFVLPVVWVYEDAGVEVTGTGS